ncbi:hypothetical protein ACP70R_008487 [Stipagrostis hirtigluma subsp. patula]
MTYMRTILMILNDMCGYGFYAYSIRQPLRVVREKNIADMASWAMLYMRNDKAVLHPYGCKFLYSSFCSNYFQLAQWSMEPAAVWVPYDFQLANWSMEPAVWVPGLPVDSASTELFGSYLQTSVPSSSKGQLVEYATATENDRIEKAAPDFEVDFHKMEMKIDVLNHEFKKAANEFQLDMSPSCLKMKMHRYPAAIQALYDERYVPKMVSIGPYHHGSDNVKQAEKVKHVAAYHCIRESGHSVQEIYDAVVSAAYDARNLYDKDVVEVHAFLVNMAALELCATPDFYEAEDEESAVCSYLRLLAMLVDREEDVHELRTKHVLQGGGGLTDKDALKFFTSLQHLRGGPCYYETMKEIQNYKETRRMQTKLHAFVYKNMKTIVMVCSAVGALVSILETIKSLKGH